MSIKIDPTALGAAIYDCIQSQTEKGSTLKGACTKAAEAILEGMAEGLEGPRVMSDPYIPTTVNGEMRTARRDGDTTGEPIPYTPTAKAAAASKKRDDEFVARYRNGRCSTK